MTKQMTKKEWLNESVFRDTFGRGAEDLVDSLFNNEENQHTRDLQEIIDSSDSNKPNDETSQRIYDYLNNLQESKFFFPV